MKTFRIEDANLFLAYVHASMKEAAKKGLLSAAIRTVSDVQNVAIPSTAPMPVDRGIYKAGWKAEAIENGAKVYNDVPYAAIIEDGGQAKNVVLGRKLIDAIAQWVQRKGIGGTTTVSKSGIARVAKVSKTEAVGIAFAIVKSLQARGLFRGTGLQVFARVARNIPKYIEEEVAKEFRGIK